MKTGRPVTQMTGRTYGTLTVGEQGPTAKGGHIMWWCTCSECGETKLVAGNNLRQGQIKSCSCQMYNAKHREKISKGLVRWARENRFRTHGLPGNYNNGCRCDACSEAHRAWRNARMEKELLDAEAGEPMRFEHGTYSAYVIGQCRCEECRAVANERTKEWAESHRDQPLPDGVEHGTRYAYSKYLCRCDDCKEANAEYQRAYKERKAEGIVNPRDAVNRVERIRKGPAA